ncbi:MAG: pyridoxal phosphate-dependent aminotransferase [Acutalibacteraceae bacterium]|nr:pyridoxal phosphate-dependent aminotransferase [Acutalibacteraceae bacterium]
MINKRNLDLGTARSAIRELFEYGKKQAEKVGAENVFDFSLGNPSTPAPDAVNTAITEILTNFDPVAVHGYTSAQGSLDARAAISNSINKRFDMTSCADEIYITCGAAAALCCVFGALTESNKTEFIAIAPYFPEYKVFVEGAGASLKIVEADTKNFQIDFNRLSELINSNTAAVIINSPNNPSGVVYSAETIKKLSNLLDKKSKEIGHAIYIVSDEPYRELVYGDTQVPYIPKYYSNTIVCYSYSKSLSLPGERIGYIYVPSFAENSKNVYAAIAGAGRAMGYVCAPSLLQKVIERCADETPNLSVYETNRKLLMEGLSEYGYEFASPDGAFYLFVKAPCGDGNLFSEKAKEKNILVVPGESFGCKEYVRISYCVKTETIMGALPYFKELI